LITVYYHQWWVGLR